MRPQQTDRGRTERIVAADAPDPLALRNEVRITILEFHGAVIRVGSERAPARVVQLEVRGRNVKRAVVIRRAEAVRAVGRESACLVAESVQATELEPRICRTRVLD